MKITGRLLLACALFASTGAAAQDQTRPENDPAPPSKGALTGTLLQVMRGIFFPAANAIFNVQAHNPAVKKTPYRTSSGAPGFDWVKWGNSLYTAWEDIDYAAVALAEATPMLLIPGRTCQNGIPVPVGRSDWKRYVDGMLEAARKSYEAARARDRKAVAESTNDLSNACSDCHRVYRERRPPGVGPGAAGAMALRCTPP